MIYIFFSFLNICVVNIVKEMIYNANYCNCKNWIYGISFSIIFNMIFERCRCGCCCVQSSHSGTALSQPLMGLPNWCVRNERNHQNGIAHLKVSPFGSNRNGLISQQRFHCKIPPHSSVSQTIQCTYNAASRTAPTYASYYVPESHDIVMPCQLHMRMAISISKSNINQASTQRSKGTRPSIWHTYIVGCPIFIVSAIYLYSLTSGFGSIFQ